LDSFVLETMLTSAPSTTTSWLLKRTKEDRRKYSKVVPVGFR
jgi:hypothetical protein